MNQPPTQPLSSLRVRVYQSGDLAYHYQPYSPGSAGGRSNPMMCGIPVDGLKPRAWFAVGDRRGLVHYSNACEGCRDGLEI